MRKFPKGDPSEKLTGLERWNAAAEHHKRWERYFRLTLRGLASRQGYSGPEELVTEAARIATLAARHSLHEWMRTAWINGVPGFKKPKVWR